MGTATPPGSTARRTAARRGSSGTRTTRAPSIIPAFGCRRTIRISFTGRLSSSPATAGARWGTRRRAYTSTITHCGGTLQIPIISSSATTAGSRLLGTGAATSSSRTGFRWDSSTPSVTIWTRPIASVADSRTTIRGAGRAVVRAVPSTITCGIRSEAGTASTRPKTQRTRTSSLASRSRDASTGGTRARASGTSCSSRTGASRRRRCATRSRFSRGTIPTIRRPRTWRGSRSFRRSSSGIRRSTTCASTGTRRSICRPTIRARSTSGRTASSSGRTRRMR